MDLLERGEFLNELQSVLTGAAAGRGRTVLVSGEAGIGKTSLIEAFAASLGGRARARLLWGACDALSTPRPLGPLHDIAQQVRGDLLERLAAGAPRAQTFSSVLDLLASSAEPTVMVFEDVHWADEATLDLIKYLGRRIHRAGAVLILTYRDDEVGFSHPLRPVIGDLPSAHVVRIWLPPLTADAVTALAQRAGRAGEHLHAVTGGNPFFVTEVLAAGGDSVPATVRDAVRARASRLSPAAQELLERVALVPGRVERRVLAHGGETAGAAIDECVSAGMLIDDDATVRFRHELARLAFETGIEPRRRRQLHAEILRVLERETKHDSARLAYHAEAAGIGDVIFKYSMEAGHEAATRAAHSQAFEHYGRALRFVPNLEPAAQAEIHERLATEGRFTDHVTEALDARARVYEIRRQLGDRVQEGHALMQLGLAMWNAGHGAEAAARCDDAIALLETMPPGPELAEAYAARAYLCMLARDADGALVWGRKGMDLARRVGAVEPLARALNAVGSAEIVAFERREGIAKLEESARLAAEAGLESRVSNALTNLGSASGEIRDYATAVRYLQEGIAFDVQRDIDATARYNTAWLARVRFEQGQWAEAGDLAAQIPIRADVSPISPIVALTVLGRIRARRGDPAADEALVEAWRLAQVTGDLQRLWPAAAGRAEAAWLSGHADRVPEIVGETLALAARLRSRWAIGELAYWMWKGDALSAPPEHAAEPFLRQIEGRWADAAAAWERIGCPYEQAMALSEGDQDAQRAALALFEGLGALPIVEIVRRSLRASGARGIPRGPRAATRSNPAGLTARELEVIELLAEGLPNAEIANRLVVSPKTVDHHVSAVLAKLEARSRAEAVAAAYRLGIVAPRDAPGST
jgi:DNA-binding CsgD family transcriptional regulator/tetratricopeptide (TPR) repeat protein